MSTKKLKVGDVLHYVPTGNSRERCNVTILSIGRKWVGLSNGQKFDSSDEEKKVPNNGYGHEFAGRCYFSAAEFEAEFLLNETWARFVFDLRWAKCPKSATLETIAEVRARLGMKQ